MTTEPNDKNTTDVEHNNPPKRSANGFRDSLPWVCGFTHRHADQFRADVGEKGIGESTPESEKD